MSDTIYCVIERLILQLKFVATKDPRCEEIHAPKGPKGPGAPAPSRREIHSTRGLRRKEVDTLKYLWRKVVHTPKDPWSKRAHSPKDTQSKVVHAPEDPWSKLHASKDPWSDYWYEDLAFKKTNKNKSTLEPASRKLQESAGGLVDLTSDDFESFDIQSPLLSGQQKISKIC